MHAGKLVFAQLMEHLPLRTFHQCVARPDIQVDIQHSSSRISISFCAWLSHN